MGLAMAPTLKPEPPHEHPVVARIGILAILLAVLGILWARYELYGTRDLEQALADPEPRATVSRAKPSPDTDNKGKRKSDVEDAVAAGRWATGFSR
jgi:hypothetical protein